MKAAALLFSRTLVTAAAVTPLLCLALAGRGWLEARFAPKARKFLWWGLGLLLAFGAVYPGAQNTAPAVRLEVPDYAVTLPAPRQEKQPQAAPPQAVGTAPAAIPAPVTPVAAPSQPETPAPSAPAARQVVLMDLLGWLWAAGAVAMGIFQAVQYLYTRRKWKKLSRPLRETETLGAQWNALAAELGVRAEFRVLPGLDGPVTLGLVRPVVFLPEGEVHPMAVRHELTHAARRDLWLKWLLLLDRAVYWFHPLVWLALPAAGRDIEAACDASVVEGLTAEEKKSYGELLLSAAAGGKGAAYATRFGGGAEQMRSRLTQIFRPGRAGRAVFAVALAVTLLAASLVACESGDTLTNGTYYATYDVFETMKKDDYSAVEVSLVDYHPEGNWFVPQEKTVTLPLAEDLTLRGERVTGDREKAIWEFLQWPMFRSVRYPGCEDVLELTLSGGQVTEMVRHEGARGAVGQVYENDSRGFSLRLPESWNGSVLAVEEFRNAPGWAVDFYDAELYREGQGEGHLLRVSLRPEEQTDLTARIKPAGRTHGWWAYYTWSQTVPVKDEAVRDRYIQMYFDGLELTEADFTALGEDAAAEDDALYVNTQYGFSLRLPDSWAGQYRVEENGGGTLIDFYQTKQEEHADRFLMSLVVASPEDFGALYGDKDLEGMYNSGGPWIKVLHEGSDVIYAHIDPVALSETPESEGEERYLTMLQDAIAELGAEDFTLTGVEATADAAEALRQALAGQVPFTDRETGETLYVNALGESDGAAVTVCRYTFLDMDGDGTEELVLWLRRGEDEYQLGSLTLRWQDGQVQGWSKGFRSMNLLTLKADGSYVVSYGGDSWGYGTMDFTGETESGTKEYTYCRGNGSGVDYFVQGAPATREEFYAAIDGEDAKPEPVWYDAATGRALKRTEDQTYEPAFDYDDMIKCMTIEGFALGTPFEDLPQSFRDALTREGAEDLMEEGAGIWTTYTAPGIEVVTTQVDPDWDQLSEDEREQYVGKEFLSVIRVSDSAYATQAGLKVGDSVERCGELGYDEILMSGDHSYRMGLQRLTLTVEDGVITAMETSDGFRYVGSIFY